MSQLGYRRSFLRYLIRLRVSGHSFLYIFFCYSLRKSVFLLHRMGQREWARGREEETMKNTSENRHSNYSFRFIDCFSGSASLLLLFYYILTAVAFAVPFQNNFQWKFSKDNSPSRVHRITRFRADQRSIDSNLNRRITLTEQCLCRMFSCIIQRWSFLLLRCFNSISSAYERREQSSHSHRELFSGQQFTDVHMCNEMICTANIFVNSI